MARARVVGAWVMIIGTLVGWPVSMFTWAKTEPPFVLSLSWLAILLTGIDILQTTQVRKDTED